MNALHGIGGSLFPGRYLVDGLQAMAAQPDEGRLERRRRQLEVWWRSVARSCGPASGLRALFDLVACPLLGSLGFRVRDVCFDRARARVRLEAAGPTPIGLVLRPWASHRSTAWREVIETARTLGTRWVFVLAPPFFSLVDTRGHAVRHSVDFTLPDVFDPESFPKFWTLAHARAFEAPAAIDAMVAASVRFQDGVRADLQNGVIDALAAFRRAVPDTPEALTLIYRLLFLLFAESRDLVPRRHPIYGRAYTIGAFCHAALAPGPATGLWQGLAAVTRLSRVGCRIDDLIVRPFNGRLFARSSAPSLETGPRRPRPTRVTSDRDDAMRRALVALSTRRGRAGREPISYADLGVEQLGAVYERVLDVEPVEQNAGRTDLQVRHDADHTSVRATRTRRVHSLRRKQTGTFYSPQPLAEFVVRRTLAPLVCGATADAILALRVVDPAMGSGAFLVAACRYLASAYERALVEEGRCAESDLDEHARAGIRRLVAERCLAGVDLNPTAVQLARLSLWLTTLSRGKPLGFLDHRLRVGNSLIGASPDDLRRVPVRQRRAGGGAAVLPLFDAAGLEDSMRLATRPLLDLAGRPDDTVEDVREKEAIWSRLSGNRSPLEPWRQAAHLWCARWFMTAPPSEAELRAALDTLLKGDATLGGAALARWLAAARAASTDHAFFHWPLEFADVFYDELGRPRPRAGFDAVIGNPPWEMLRRESGTGHSALGTGEDSMRGAHQPLVRFIRESGLYPSCDRGHLNLYQPFLERALSLTRTGGRVGLILPWGLAADDGASALRRHLVARSGLDTIVGFDNAQGLFPIHRGVRFCVVVAGQGAPDRGIRARFGVKTAEEIDDLPDRDDSADTPAYPIRLSGRHLASIGGAACRIPDLRDARDLALLDALTSAHPALGDPSGWSVRFGRELNATEDRASFGAHGLPVVEGKHLSPFTVETTSTAARIERREAARLLPDGRFDRARLAYRDVSGVGNRVSLIAAIVPGGVVTTHTVFCLRSDVPIERQHYLCGLFNSYVLNAIVRMLMGGHVTTSLVEGLPVPPWTGAPLERRIARLAGALSRGRHRSGIHAALQAAVARRYGLGGDMFAHVLRGFPLVPAEERRRAWRAFGAFGWSPGSSNGAPGL